jgi:hypothetical protein
LKRTFVTAASLLFVPALALAQATASLEVAVRRADLPVPGATILLGAPGLERSSVTDERGSVVFLHLPGGRFWLSVEAPPAARETHEIELAPGREQAIVLALGTEAGPRAVQGLPPPAERVFDGEDLRASPRPADPWSILRDVPGVVLDRVNVGGSETAQQSLLVSRGDTGTGAVWTLDGIDVTDPAALGSLSLYPDTGALESVQVRTRALDVRARTPGAQVALRLREPTLRRSGAVHLRGTGGPLQADNLPDALSGRPFFRNHTDGAVEAGAELGGPLGDGRLWLWAAASRNALRQDTFTEHRETLATTALTARARLRLDGGSLSLVAVRAEKTHDGRDAVLNAAPEARWRQSGATHVVAVEHQRTFGGISVLTRAGWVDGGFRLDPVGGASADPFEDFRGVFQGSYSIFETSRPRLHAGVEAATRRRAFGLEHDLLAGAAYRRSSVTTRQRWPGGAVLALERQTPFFRAFRLTGFALPTRAQHARSLHDHVEAFVQDSARRGRLGVTAGLRLDRLAGRNLASSVEANPVFPDLLPAVSFGGTPSRIRWVDLLPRLRVSWDLAADGSTAVALGYAAYGAPLGSGEVVFDNPVGREGASLSYYWNDRNGDRVVQPGELDDVRGRIGASGVDPDASGAPVSPHVIDPDLRSPRTHELSGSAVQRLGSVVVRVDGSWRRQVGTLWRPLRGLALADYVARGAVRGELFGDDYAVTYFAPASVSRIVPGNGRLLTNREGYRQDAFTFTLDVEGTLGGRTRYQAWAAVTDWRERFTDPALSLQDPTPLEGEPLQDLGVVAVRAGGLGRADLFVNARWTAGGSVRARLPLGLDGVVQVHAREGFPIPYYQAANTGDPTGGSKNVLVSEHLDSYRLPALVLLELRLARGFRVGPGLLTGAVDVFNALNQSTALQVGRDVELTSLGRPREILRPRIARLGVEFRF